MNDDLHMLIKLQDAHHASYQDDLAYWKGLAERFRGPILELGCGTGRVYLPLFHAGFSIFGLDNEAAALQLLKQRIQQSGGDPARVFLADMASFQLPAQFNLIICPCNTFSTLSEAHRAAALAAIRHHLVPGGCFAASIPNPELLFDLRSQPEPALEADFLDPESGDPVQVSSSFVRRGSILQLAWHYDRLLPDGRVQRLTARVDQNIQRFSGYQTQLQSAGLEINHLWGDFDRSSYTPESPNLIWGAVTADVMND